VALNRSILALILIISLGFNANAQEEGSDSSTSSQTEEEIPVFQFSEQELPKEAVLPKLDTPKAVLNRKLSYAERFQADLGAGWLLDEAFFNNQFLMVQGSYSWDEPNGVGFRYLMFGNGLSDYGKQFEAVAVNPPDFDRSKGPSTGWTAFYERRMMYGKLSTSKWNVIPAFLAWDVHAGLIKYGARQLPIVGASVANRFFVSKNFATNLNIRADVRQFVDPLSADLRAATAPSEDEFKTTTKFSMTLDFGVSYLF
jgi:hypothetical protein